MCCFRAVRFYWRIYLICESSRVGDTILSLMKQSAENQWLGPVLWEAEIKIWEGLAKVSIPPPLTT